MRRKLAVAWRVVVAFIYVLVALVLVSSGKTPFETFVLAILVQLYAALLYNFLIIGRATDINNYAGFVRFRILAHAQGQTEDETGAFVDQENALSEILTSHKTYYIINSISHFLVSIVALYKIVATVLGL